MRFEVFNILKNLEVQIESGYPIIFKGYKAVNKRGVEKIIDELYATLPADVLNARKYLKDKNIELQNNPKAEGLYDNLKKFETTMGQALQVASYVIVNIRELEDLIDRIYSNIPDEIIKAHTLSKD